ncbi:hypothetical protein OKJ48_18155 [Streptomyces kunmingensis]|uniref:5'-nucleotidase n=1 Tax=Streptomyces kunmingensis TaxID=68225 RepID=A0ABU6CBW3_9ACTN|nr:hypothetical protein [Streptomyces kunmingensis]MEB3962158.1 hypothetical protein [Streptomyces kunmingensis]
MKRLARVLIVTSALTAAVLTTAGAGSAAENIGWPSAPGTTAVAGSADIGWPSAPGTTATATAAGTADIGWPVIGA